MKKKRLLIFHQGALGDLVTTFPALRQLRAEYPSIDAICQKKLGALAAAFNLIDKGFPIESSMFASLFSGPVHPKVQQIVGTYHTIVLFSYSIDLERVIGNLTDQYVFRIPPRPVQGRKIHVTDHVLSSLRDRELISRNDIAYSTLPPFLLSIDRQSPGYDPSLVWIHPGSGSPKKNWPMPYFIQIAGALKSDGMQPNFILGPAEHHILPNLQQTELTWHLVEDLIELAALLKTGGGFIGNDSGVTHLAAFLGLPTAAIFGPTDPTRWRPMGRAVKVITPDVDCTPCFESDSDPCRTMDCLNSISPIRVLEKFYSILPQPG